MAETPSSFTSPTGVELDPGTYQVYDLYNQRAKGLEIAQEQLKSHPNDASAQALVATMQAEVEAYKPAEQPSGPQV